MLSETEVKNEYITCLGLTNKVGDKGYVLFLDYDDKTHGSMLADVYKLIDKYKLSWVYILDSKGDGMHWHVICPQIFDAYDMLAILWDCDCDVNYKKQFFTVKERTLRISRKSSDRSYEVPQVVEIINQYTSDMPRAFSTAHLSFIETYMKAEVPKINVIGIQEQLQFVKYNTPTNQVYEYDMARMVDNEIDTNIEEEDSYDR